MSFYRFHNNNNQVIHSRRPSWASMQSSFIICCWLCLSLSSSPSSSFVYLHYFFLSSLFCFITSFFANLHEPHAGFWCPTHLPNVFHFHRSFIMISLSLFLCHPYPAFDSLIRILYFSSCFMHISLLSRASSRSAIKVLIQPS